MTIQVGSRVALVRDPFRKGTVTEVDSEHVTFGITTTRVLWDDLKEYHSPENDETDIQWTNKLTLLDS